jgi:uncharacterized protein (DUF433 family)
MESFASTGHVRQARQADDAHRSEAMKEPMTGQSSVIRTSRGLTIAGTRTTLYQVMDCLNEEWPPRFIQDWLNLTEKQMADVMAYIDSHREEVVAEYQLVLQQAEEIRNYWEDRNRTRFAEIAAAPAQPGQEEVRAKLQEWKSRLAREP